VFRIPCTGTFYFTRLCEIEVWSFICVYRSAHAYRKAKPETMSLSFQGEITTTRRSAVFSLFRPLRFKAKTRRHDKQRARTRKISPRRHENLNNEIFVPSCVKVSFCRLDCFVFSCLCPENRKSK
jgi:hypothetical protein